MVRHLFQTSLCKTAIVLGPEFQKQKGNYKKGKVTISGLRVTIENPEGEVIWVENLQVKDNGEFSTLLIAAGKGWEKSGQYELISKHESLESKVTFDVTE